MGVRELRNRFTDSRLLLIPSLAGGFAKHGLPILSTTRQAYVDYLRLLADYYAGTYLPQAWPAALWSIARRNGLRSWVMPGRASYSARIPTTGPGPPSGMHPTSRRVRVSPRSHRGSSRFRFNDDRMEPGEGIPRALTMETGRGSRSPWPSRKCSAGTTMPINLSRPGSSH